MPTIFDYLVFPVCRFQTYELIISDVNVMSTLSRPNYSISERPDLPTLQGHRFSGESFSSKIVVGTKVIGSFKGGKCFRRFFPGESGVLRFN